MSAHFWAVKRKTGDEGERGRESINKHFRSNNNRFFPLSLPPLCIHVSPFLIITPSIVIKTSFKLCNLSKILNRSRQDFAGSSRIDVFMGSQDSDLMEEGRRGGEAPVVTCSICFESVADNGGRSWAKLQCQHTFHLDCIGSAFNAKGVMQCPNCRKIEKGQWLYANGTRSCSEFSIDDWAHEEDIYDLSFSEMPFGFQWCPFGGLTRLPSSSGERELPSAYHDLLGHHAIFTEQAAPTSAGRSCPYFAYFHPVQYSSRNSNEGNVDSPNTGHHWGGFPGPSDISISHTFPAADLYYHTWDHPAPSFSFGSRDGGVDHVPVSTATSRSSRSGSDGQPRSASIVHPVILSHGSGPRAGSVVVSPGVPLYPGINYRRHGRPLGRSYRHHQQSSMRLPVFSVPRGSSGPRAPGGPLASLPEHTNGYSFPSSRSSVRNLQQTDNSLRSHFYAPERGRFAPFPLIPVDGESNWRGLPHGLDSGNMYNSIWHDHGAERASLNGSEN